ncbi:MAG TPA: glycosyltransferase family 9 protein, partial [Pseudomonadales bacterium]|nr:glycosyltransferase family 9 protein [Pseudomonadales bacterium]
LFGSTGDRSVTAGIRAALAAQAQLHCADLAGHTTLADAIDLLACASAVLSNDSGLMHVAAALGRPLAVVYGGSSPRFTPPLVDDPVLFTSSLDCVPCFDRTCRYGHYRCLQDQLPGPVAAAVLRLAGR